MIQCHMPPLHSIGGGHCSLLKLYKFTWFPEKTVVAIITGGNQGASMVNQKNVVEKKFPLYFSF